MHCSSPPRVSVVIPTHNRAELLPRAIRSVLAQTFQDFEILIVDDASMDPTPEVAQSFTGPRIRYLRHERNRGLAAVRNTGIANSRGEFIAYLDDDDEWLPRKLEKQAAIMELCSASVGAVHCGTDTVSSSSGEVLRRLTPSPQDVQYDRLRYFPNALSLGGSTLLFRRSCFERVGLFDEQFVVHQQYEMWFRMAREFEIASTPEVLVRCYMHEGRHLSHDLMRRIDSTQKFVSKHREELSKYPCDLRRHYLRLGMMHTQVGQPREARRWLGKCLRLRPLQPKAWLYYACSLHPALRHSVLEGGLYATASQVRIRLLGNYR